MSVYVALLHYPVYNKKEEVVTTSITAIDISDIARSCTTYGVKKYFVVNPISGQRQFAERILNHWKKEEAQNFNPTRGEALDHVSVVSDLREAVDEISRSSRPIIVATSAKDNGTYPYAKLRSEIKKSKDNYLILLGTGWGMVNEVMESADIVLPPIKGNGKFNHLSVRGAAAIILDRLLSKED